MKGYLTTILLCTAICLISIGIHIENIIVACIGGALAAVYNDVMIYKQD